MSLLVTSKRARGQEHRWLGFLASVTKRFHHKAIMIAGDMLLEFMHRMSKHVDNYKVFAAGPHNRDNLSIQNPDRPSIPTATVPEGHVKI